MRIFAPFADEVVRSVNEYQSTAEHPYTCVCGAKLIAVSDGTLCENGHKARDFLDFPDAALPKLRR